MRRVLKQSMLRLLPQLLAGGVPLALFVLTRTASSGNALLLVSGDPSVPALLVWLVRGARAVTSVDPLALASLLALAFGAATSVLLSATLLRLTVRPWLAVLVPWLLVLSPIFWNEAASGGALPFTAIIVVATLFLFVRWQRTRRRGTLVAAAAAVLLLLGATPLAFLFAPACVLFVAAPQPRTARRRLARWVPLALLALAAALAIRFAPQYFLAIVPRDLNGALVSGTMAQALASLRFFALEAAASIGLLALGAAAYGAITLFRQERSLGALLLWCAASPAVAFAAFVLAARVAADASALDAVLATLFPSFTALLLLAGAGLERLLEQVQYAARRALSAPVVGGAVFAALALLLGLQTAAVASQTVRPTQSAATFFANALLASVPERSLLLIVPKSEGDRTLLAALRYAQRFAAKRPDVRIAAPDLSMHLLASRATDVAEERAFVLAALETGAAEHRPVAATRPFTATGFVRERPDGAFLLLTDASSPPEPSTTAPQESSGPSSQDLWRRMPAVASSVADAQILADALYNRALFFAAAGDRDRAAHATLHAIQIDPMPQSPAFRRFLTSRQFAQTLAPRP